MSEELGEDIWPEPTLEEVISSLEDTEQRIADYRTQTATQYAARAAEATGGVLDTLFGTWIKSAWEALRADIERREGLPHELRQALLSKTEEPTLGSLLILIFSAVVLFSTEIQATISAFAKAKLQQTNAEVPLEIPPYELMLRLMRRGIISYPEYVEYAKRQGISQWWSDRIMAGTVVLPDPDEIGRLYLRGEIDESAHDDLLRQLGYWDQTIQYRKRLYWLIPGPQDLIRMAVREAFDDLYAERYGTDERFPEEFRLWAQKQGLSEYWAKRFWRAHWELPSIQMGFEMLHRRVIGPGELDDLMHALDIMPWWRERLKKISYRPLTRVDVRRMYRLGVLDRDQVKEAYLDLGYDQTNAERMVEFTVRYETQQDRDLSKTEILKGYRTKVLTKDEAHTLLVQLGYSSAESDYLLALEDIREQEELEELATRTLKALYLKHQVDRGTVIAELSGLGFSARRIDTLVNQWDVQRQAQRRRPSKEDWLRWYKLGIVSSDKVKNELWQLGYDWEYADLYIKEIDRLKEQGG